MRFRPDPDPAPGPRTHFGKIICQLNSLSRGHRSLIIGMKGKGGKRKEYRDSVSHGTYIRWYLRIGCARTDKSLLLHLFKAFD